ncbi:MAG: peptide-N(4)-(N-acetyl-beta-glucosaminyl)asparagine amidase [Proteobacteria bacterium]|nr:peptide-N(4)-(N-acetyl-beta-glucosaminyl)asparagine amidase [Pseudomonadota bacterium]
MQPNSNANRRRPLALLIACALAGIAATATASAGVVGPPIPIGQKGVATPDPLVPVPPVRPCVVKLYTATSATGTFNDYANHPFNYTPPANCPGPWNKVVFKADFSVSKGRQFDRTAALWIGGANVFFGTTQEPSSKVSPRWHVERDVTDLSALLGVAHPANVALYNIYNATYNGSITGSAELDFYPASSTYPAAKAPDVVVGLTSDPAGSYAYIDTDGNPLARTLSLPANAERAYLDVIAQAQSGDEFWYTCAPDAFAASLNSCGGTAFRETQVTIDGQEAGIAPVSAWIFTGGIDPYLWRPIPGVQTLNFVPFRVDLTPFVALLDNGQPHTIALRVVTGDSTFQNAGQYFATAGNLLLYLDHGSTQVTGSVQPVIDTGVHPATTTTQSPDQTQLTFDTVSRHSLLAIGTANTSHGVVKSRAAQTLAFENKQNILNTATQFEQTINQTSTASYSSSSSWPSGSSYDARNWSFPLSMDINYVVAGDGSATQTTTANQGYTRVQIRNGPDGYFSSTRSQSANPTDTLNFDSNGNFTGPSGQGSSSSYFFKDNAGACYSRTVSAASGAVTAVSNGAGCGSGPAGIPAQANPRH